VRFALLLLSLPLTAQSLHVYSEFAQINAKGEVTAPAQPREILSPAIVRNGFTSFQIVVEVEPDTPYWLYVGQNPENAVHVTAHRRVAGKLEPVELPAGGKATEVFWIDLWADRDAPVRRIKVQPQLSVKGDWVEYPMEVRVMDAVVPEGVDAQKHDMRELLCGPYRRYFSYGSPQKLRNLAQDVAMAKSVPKQELVRLLGACELISDDSETYLRIRDYLFRMR
jgi:hypothetical protein